MITDIGADATAWSSELDSDVVKKHIADVDSENGAGSEVGVGFVKEKLIMQFDDATDGRYWTGQSVGLKSDCGIAVLTDLLLGWIYWLAVVQRILQRH